MGRAARVKAMQREELKQREVHWVGCEVCGLDFPTEAKPSPYIERLNMCQRCCVQDIARLMREIPERVRFFPTVRALQGLPQVKEIQAAYMEATKIGNPPPVENIITPERAIEILAAVPDHSHIVTNLHPVETACGCVPHQLTEAEWQDLGRPEEPRV